MPRFLRPNLPCHDRVNGVWYGCAGMSDQLAEQLGGFTAHVVTAPKRHGKCCNKCGKYVETYVSKPGSLVVWCLQCW